MNYHNIVHEDMNNGDGIRVTVFVSGCEHHCPNCQNPQTWRYDSGIPFDDDAVSELFIEMSKDYISGVTFSGGDPLAPKNLDRVRYTIAWLKKCFPTKTVWVYTGYTFEYLLARKDPEMKHLLRNIDVLVDGRYIEELRDVNLKWRGSSNQRVIDVKKSLMKGREVLYCD